MTVILILFVILVVAIFLSGNYTEFFENTPVIPQLPPVPYGTAVGANAGSNNSGFDGISSYDEIRSYDTANNALYKERIINKVPPPNVYLTDEMEYSPETVMANVNDVRQEVQRYQMELPNLVAVYVNDHMRELDR